MTIGGFLVLLLIAAICGGIGQAIAGYSMGGCLISAVVGFVGAFLGMWLAKNLGLPTIFLVDIQGQSFPVVWSIIGSTALVLVLAAIGARR